MKYNPNRIIIHAETNDLKSDKGPIDISNEIIKLANNVKMEENIVTISGIISRNDELNDKAREVNQFLKIKTATYGLQFIENSNLNPKTHLNKKGLHLNNKGTCQLVKNCISHKNQGYLHIPAATNPSSVSMKTTMYTYDEILRISTIEMSLILIEILTSLL